MTPLLSAFAAGLVFALGLGVSGMTLPSRVKGFLDVAGAWDPSLAFVMLSALATHIALLRWILRRRAPISTRAFDLPTRRDIDRPLLVGAALFGVGWGLGGYCPGPALTSLATLGRPALVMCAAMAAGMMLSRRVHQ